MEDVPQTFAVAAGIIHVESIPTATHRRFSLSVKLTILGTAIYFT